MPLVRIEILEGRSAAYKKALLDGVHAALVECFRVPEDDRCQRLHELPPERFERPPSRSDRFTSVELTVFKGRSLEAKRRLYAAIVANLNARQASASRRGDRHPRAAARGAGIRGGRSRLRRTRVQKVDL
jgi:5-carboxymethyl-2-hydroxymuconate isomerase